MRFYDILLQWMNFENIFKRFNFFNFIFRFVGGVEDLPGFFLALKYFEKYDIISWFSGIKHIPWIFINVLCYIDRKLTENLSNSSPCPSKRTFYNYIIIDAVKFTSLMTRQSGFALGENEPNFHDFKLFESSVVYVGKGTNYRKNMHFKCAKKVHVGLIAMEGVTGQVKAICRCWRNGGGVMCVQVESDSTSHEAHCREAAMISALGLGNIANKNAGVAYGDMRQWSSIKLNNYGEMLLFLAFKSFIAKRPPVVRAADVVLSRVPRMKKSLLCAKCGLLN